MSDYPCPRCGRSFETRRGVGVHHWQVHGERLPNRACAHCGTAFHLEHERKYCSEACRRVAVSRSGSDNPNYRGAKETAECQRCGDEFEYYPSEKAGSYCPDCVESADWRSPPSLTGADNPQWSGGECRIFCAVCDTPVSRYPSEIPGAVVCSEECRRERLSTAFSGPGHPNWGRGDDLTYGGGWSTVRSRALERDGHRCRLCGTTRDDLGQNPDVHHVVPVRWFDRSEEHDKSDAYTLDNVVSLCRSCHRAAESGDVSRDELRELIDDSPGWDDSN